MVDQDTSLFDLLLLPENFYLAWRKAKKYYSQLEIWHDDIAISAFELNLEEELHNIREQFKTGHYRLSPLLPLPLPKKINFEDPSQSKNRQAFFISVADQVAWLAFVNVVGPRMDKLMPPWSYGNRLYRAAWYEDDGVNDDKKLKIGPYRHSAGHIYRKFQHSWPLYKRHVLLTIRQMVTKKTRKFFTLNEADEKEAQFQDAAPKSSQDKIEYRQPGYWSKSSDSVFWTGLDLKTFYPNIRNTIVADNLDKHLFQNDKKRSELMGLTKDLLAFSTKIPSSFTSEDLKCIEPLFEDGAYAGIPTYLMVAGFLANVVMLDIDSKVTEISKKWQIAHFRYVDDHIILSQKFDALVGWIKNYKELLSQYQIGPQINDEKFEPKEISDYIGKILRNETATDEEKNKALSAAQLNPKFPSPLMTTALAQISTLGQNDFDVLSNDEQSKRLGELEHLLLTEFPEREIREATRISFAASKIASIAPKKRWSTHNIISFERKLNSLGEIKKGQPIGAMQKELKSKIKKEEAGLTQKINKFYARYFMLLLESFCRHPEKARLLKHILLYQAKTGHDGFSEILNAIKKINTANKLAASHLMAVLLQTVSSHMVRSIMEVKEKNLLYRDEEARLNFIKSALKKIQIDKFGVYQNTYYLDESKKLYLWAKTITEVFLKERGLVQPATALESTWQNLGDNRFAWLWWFEKFRLNFDNREPDLIWLRLSPTLKSTRKMDELLLRLYSNQKSTQEILPTSITEMPPVLSNALLIVRDSKKLTDNLRSKRSEYITLLDWITWTKEENANPNDPRIGEWTAIEIMRQIISMPNVIGRRKRKTINTYHPVSYLVPKKWTLPPTDTVIPDIWTWESWRTAIQPTSQAIIFDDENLRELELYSSWENKEPYEQNLHELYWAGFLMLCLLTKEYSWPPEWNLPGQRRATTYWMLKAIRTLNCSSRTTSILESCLSTRTRETDLLTKFPSFAGEQNKIELNDTVLDPRVINDFQDLANEIKNAQKILIKYQMTVLQHMPRQLIPMNIKQLGRLPNDGSEEDDA